MLKLGIYSFDKMENGFMVYRTVKNFYNQDGSPYLERAYSLDFKRDDNNKLWWNCYAYDGRGTLSGDDTPKTIASFANAVWAGKTIYNF